MSDKNYLESKRIKVLENIKPICEAFNIKDYDYIVNIPRQNEILRVYDVYIGCCNNSIEAVVNELIGYIVIRLYCKHRSLGAFDKQTKNHIKQYWIKEERLKELGLLKEGNEDNEKKIKDLSQEEYLLICTLYDESSECPLQTGTGYCKYLELDKYGEQEIEVEYNGK